MTVRLRVFVLAAAVFGAPSLPGALEAQEVEARIGRFFDGDGWTAYRLGVTRPLGGAVRYQVHADVMRDLDGSGSLAGPGLDLTAFRTGEGPYLVAGLSGGMGSERSGQFDELWGSWSAGAGYDVFPLSFLSVGAEGRWRQVSLGRRDGFEVALGLSLHLGSRRSRDPETQVPAAAVLRTPQNLADSIITTASEAMGRPYSYGGTGQDGEGFDCSGLIQYSYGKHGIALPRRSTDQAKEGRKIERTVGKLAPADILTFSNRGGQVTHVGLYMGEGRFIHSATRGVQVSVLSPDDPYGRWWYKRWVGVRRIVR
jgi:hypothetical protein